MAQITTYDDGNLLEDVMLSVTNIAPTDRPFTESIGRKRATQPLHQWPEDTLDARASAATLEGANIPVGTSVSPSRVTNYTEYVTQTWQVTNTEIASKGAGVDDMFMYQRNKKMKVLINDIEYDLINSTLVTGSKTVTRKMAGAIAFITSNVVTATSGVTLTEVGFNALFQLAWAAGGNPRSVFVNSNLKKAITGFAGVSLQKQIQAEKKTMVNAIDFYINDYTGTAEILLSRDVPNTSGSEVIMIIDTSFFSTAYLIPIRDAEVGQTTFGKLGALEAELTLEVRAQAGNAIGTNYNN